MSWDTLRVLSLTISIFYWLILQTDGFPCAAAEALAERQQREWGGDRAGGKGAWATKGVQTLLWSVITLLQSPALPSLVPALLPSPPLHRHGVFVCLHEELNHQPGRLEKNESKKRERDYFPAVSGLVS